MSANFDPKPLVEWVSEVPLTTERHMFCLGTITFCKAEFFFSYWIQSLYMTGRGSIKYRFSEFIACNENVYKCYDVYICALPRACAYVEVWIRIDTYRMCTVDLSKDTGFWTPHTFILKHIAYTFSNQCLHLHFRAKLCFHLSSFRVNSPCETSSSRGSEKVSN